MYFISEEMYANCLLQSVSCADNPLTYISYNSLRHDLYLSIEGSCMPEYKFGKYKRYGNDDPIPVLRIHKARTVFVLKKRGLLNEIIPSYYGKMIMILNSHGRYYINSIL
jgi:hypothetical protein